MKVKLRDEAGSVFELVSLCGVGPEPGGPGGLKGRDGGLRSEQ